MPKKWCHCHPIKLKKPEVTPDIDPMASKKPKVSPIATHMAEAILKKLDQVEKDAMTGVELSIPTDPPPSCFKSLLLPNSFSKKVFLKAFLFPHKFDCVKIERWLAEAKKLLVAFEDISAIMREAGHTDPDCL